MDMWSVFGVAVGWDASVRCWLECGGACTLGRFIFLKRDFGTIGQLKRVWIQLNTTLSNGYLGSHNDEERSEMRYVMRIAEFSESSNL